MKNNLKTLLAGIVLLSGMAGMNIFALSQFNIPKITEEIYTLAITTPTNNAADIEITIQKALEQIPNELLGYELRDLKNGIIDARLATIISQFIGEGKKKLDFVVNLTKNPVRAVELAGIAYNEFAQNLPASIQGVLASVLNLATQVATSANPIDQAGVSALQQALAAVQIVVNNLAIANATGTLVGYNLGNDINNLRNTIRTIFPAIKALIENNMSAITSIVNQATVIKLSELGQLTSVAENLIGTANYQTAQNALSNVTGLRYQQPIALDQNLLYRA